jgi:hypothetical protein
VKERNDLHCDVAVYYDFVKSEADVERNTTGRIVQLLLEYYLSWIIL